MPTFEYQATKPDGSPDTGLVFGTSLDAVAGDLRARGLNVTRLGVATAAGDPLAEVVAPAPKRTEGVREAQPLPTEDRGYFATSVAGPLVGTVPLTDLAFLFRQGGSMLQAGVPIVQSLNTLANQSRNGKLKSILHETTGYVENGRPISESFQRYPEVFGPVIVSLLRAGEEGGFVDSVLTNIADYLDQENELRRLYKRVTFYPKLQVVASIVIVLGANAILASIKPGARGLSSPLTTPSTWFWLAPLIVAIFLFLKVGLANPRIRFNWDAFVSHIPYLGNTMRQLAMARFGRAFAALYRAGVPMVRAIGLSADACGNEYLRARMQPAMQRVREGEGITVALRDTGAFSPIVLDMVGTGESTGNLDAMLQKVGDFYIAEAEVRQVQLGYAVGVLLGLLVAIYIGYIVISFYTGFGADVTEQIKEANG